VRVEVSVSNWDLDEQNQVRILAPTEQSLDQWMITNPTQFTVPPDQSQVVRFAIRPRVRPTPGEHRAIVYFTQQAPDTPADDRIQILFRLGAVIYAYVGEVTHRGRLLGVTRDAGTNPPGFQLDIASEGNAHVRLNGQYLVWPESAYPGRPGTRAIDGLGKPTVQVPKPLVAAGRLPTTPVLPGSRRSIPLLTGRVLEPGGYVLDIQGILGDVPIDRAVPFTVSTTP
jgi:hypothetical protein